MPIYVIHHTTKYQYDLPVIESINEIKIFPYLCAEQELLQQDLHISYSPMVQTAIDYWKNKVGTFSIIDAHTELIIENRLTVRTTAPTLLQVNFHSKFEELKAEVRNNLRLIELTKADKIKRQNQVQQIIDQILQGESKSIAEIVEECSSIIFKHFKYVKGITDIETTVDQILTQKAGVCQDFAHLMLQVLRSIGIPSRYVSGYICPNRIGMRGEGATHAWVEAYIPEYGWAGIDPTNNVWVTNNHVKLAIGRDFNDCSPVKGTFRGNSEQHLFVNVSIHYEDGKTFEQTNAVKMRDSFAQYRFSEDNRLHHQQQQ